MRNSRLIGGKPKIGIRPIIDGRRGGIRESLEDMTIVHDLEKNHALMPLPKKTRT